MRGCGHAYLHHNHIHEAECEEHVHRCLEQVRQSDRRRVWIVQLVEKRRTDPRGECESSNSHEVTIMSEAVWYMFCALLLQAVVGEDEGMTL